MEGCLWQGGSCCVRHSLGTCCLQDDQRWNSCLGSAPPCSSAALLDPRPASLHCLRVAEAQLHRVLSTCSPPRLQDDQARWKSLGSASLHSNFMAPAVIGSLPQGMTLDERQRMMASTPLSPSLQLLNSMPMVSAPFPKELCLLWRRNWPVQHAA